TVGSVVYCSGQPRDLSSFPTRRSSDLPAAGERWDAAHGPGIPWPGARGSTLPYAGRLNLLVMYGAVGHGGAFDALGLGKVLGGRSEEHTSELQSRENLVCRLLLEKKKP